MQPEDYRQLFPITEKAVYLNHAAVSPFSERVTCAIREVLKERSEGKIDIYQSLVDTRSGLKENIAALIQAEPGQIAIIANTSEGFNWLVQGLQWQPGDRILLAAGEFPSNIYPFMHMESRGVALDLIPGKESALTADDVAAEVRPETRLLSVSFVGFFRGFRAHLQEIGAFCRENGIIFSVDGIQGVGALDLDVRKCRIDFLSNGGHKWLMGPQGCGFMYIAPSLHARLRPAFVGWLSVKDSWNFLDYRLDLLDDAGRYEIGTPNVLGIYGLNAATGLLLEVGISAVEKHILALGDQLIPGMTDAGFEYIGAADPTERSGIYTFRTGDVDALHAALKNRNIHVAVRNNAVRIAPHFYNSSEDIAAVVRICREILQS